MNVLSGLGHGWHNVVSANGVTISIIGMLLVFFSLAVITLIISSTPYILKLVSRFYPEQEESVTGNGVKKVSEMDIVAAIGAALCHSMDSSNNRM